MACPTYSSLLVRFRDRARLAHAVVLTAVFALATAAVIALWLLSGGALAQCVTRTESAATTEGVSCTTVRFWAAFASALLALALLALAVVVVRRMRAAARRDATFGPVAYGLQRAPTPE